MGQTETALKDETIEKMESAGSPAEEKEPSLGSVSRRPFVLKRRHGSSSGNLALMLIVVGTIVVFGIAMVAFPFDQGHGREKAARRVHQTKSRPNARGHFWRGSCSE